MCHILESPHTYLDLKPQQTWFLLATEISDHYLRSCGNVTCFNSRPQQTATRQVYACIHGSTNGTNGRPISFKVLPMVPLVIPLVPMVPLVKTDGSQYCRQSTVWAKLPTLESHMIKYGVLIFKFINFTNKHCFYQDDIHK